MSSYISEIVSIDTEIRRLNSVIKQLREQKKVAQGHLHQIMESTGKEEMSFNGHKITKKQCAPPKPRAKAKPKGQRKNDALELFKNVGIPNPEQFYSEYQQTQKSAQK